MSISRVGKRRFPIGSRDGMVESPNNSRPHRATIRKLEIENGPIIGLREH